MLASILALGLALGGWVPSVARADEATVDKVVLQSGDNSVAIITFDASASIDEAVSGLDPTFDWTDAEFSAGTLTLIDQKAVTIDPRLAASWVDSISLSNTASSPYTQIYCDRSYAFADQNGRFTLQRQCGIGKAPWGYTLSSNLQSIAASPVRESGMSWTKNTIYQPQMSPHTEPASYLFHGAFSVNRDDAVNYADTFTFRHNVGSGGYVKVTVFGAVRFRGAGG